MNLGKGVCVMAHKLCELKMQAAIKAQEIVLWAGGGRREGEPLGPVIRRAQSALNCKTETENRRVRDAAYKRAGPGIFTWIQARWNETAEQRQTRALKEVERFRNDIERQIARMDSVDPEFFSQDLLILRRQLEQLERLVAGKGD